MDESVIQETFLTTNDNPFNPFTQFKDWYSYDRALGYYTPELIDRMFQSLDVDEKKLDEETIEKLRTIAMRKIVSIQPEIYKLVTNDTYVDTIPMNEETETD